MKHVLLRQIFAEGHETHHMIALQEELFLLSTPETAIETLFLVIASSRNNPVYRLDALRENGTSSPAGLIYPDAFRVRKSSSFHPPAHDAEIIYNETDKTCRFEDQVYEYSFDPLCPCRNNLIAGENSRLSHPFQDHTGDDETAIRCQTEAVSFALGIWEAIGDTSPSHFKRQILEAVSAFAARAGVFYNDGRRPSNYIDVWSSRPGQTISILLREAALMGNRAFRYEHYVNGPAFDAIGAFADPRLRQAGRDAGALIANESEATIMLAGLDARKTHDRTFSPRHSSLYSEWADAQRTAHETMASTFLSSQLEELFPVRDLENPKEG